MIGSRVGKVADGDGTNEGRFTMTDDGDVGIETQLLTCISTYPHPHPQP